MTTDQKPTAEETQALVARVAAYYGVPLDFKKAAKITEWNRANAAKTLLKAQDYIGRGQAHKGAFLLEPFAGQLIESVGEAKAESLAVAAAADHMRDALDLAVAISTLVSRWRAVATMDAADELRASGLFTEKELNDELEPYAEVQVDELLESDYTRVFALKRGSAPLPRDAKFRIPKAVQVSPDLDGYIRAAHYLAEKTPGAVTFVPFFKVEERVDLSFWAFFIVYEDHVWVATDQKEFHNPQNKSCTRRTDRVRDAKLEKVWLPDVFAMLEKKRSASREVAAFGGLKRLLEVPLSKFHPTERFFLVRLGEMIVRRCLREDLPAALTMGMHSERLLLEHKGAVPQHDELLEGWNKDVQAHHREMMETVPQVVTKALAPMDYSLVISSPTYDRNWLGTPKQLDALAHWTVVDARRAQIQEHFDALKKRDEKDLEALRALLIKNERRVIETAFAAGEVGWVFYGVQSFGGGYAGSGKKHINLFVSSYEKKNFEYGYGWGCVGFVGCDGDYKALFRRAEKYRAKCGTCPSSVKKPARIIHIRHWAQLAFLVGGRENLPPYYRCYRAHNHVPYHGNSILYNTNPLAEITDPCTREHPNGMHISVFRCGNCVRKLVRATPERAVWDGQEFVAPESIKGLARGVYTYGWKKKDGSGFVISH